MWKHKNFINLQLHAPNIAYITINFDSHISKVVYGDAEWTTSGQNITTAIFDGATGLFTITLDSGYVLDTVTLGSDFTNATLTAQTDTSFDLLFGNSAGGTITLTSKQLEITTADIISSIRNNLQNAYNAIGNKSGTMPTQKNLANLAESINTISVGINTSDATATAVDILKDKTAYVKGANVVGTIETYNGTVEDVVVGETWVLNERLTLENIPYYDIPFTSAGQSYAGMKVNIDSGGAGYVRYYKTPGPPLGDFEEVYTKDGPMDGWNDSKWRIITYPEPMIDVTVRPWLQSNGTKQ